MSSPLTPIASALYEALNVDSLKALALGGVFDDVPVNPTFPFVLCTIDATFTGGLGTNWSTQGCWELPFRIYIYSQYAGWQEAQGILAEVVSLIEGGLAANGFDISATFNDTAHEFADQLIAGVKCKELVLSGRIYAETSA